MIKFFPFYFLLAIVFLTSCALKNGQKITSEETVSETYYKIVGSFLYREKISLPKDSVAIITLSDISRADSKAIIITQQKIDLNDKSVPIQYELITGVSNINRNMRYGLRVEIRNKYQELLWTTDEVNLIDVQKTEQSMPPLFLKRIIPLDAHQPTPHLIGIKWYVVTINGHQVVDPTKAHLQFATDGKFHGSTGCNNFSGNFIEGQGNLSFDRLAMTRRACIFQLNDQEKNYFQILNTISHYRLNRDGKLILIASNGKEMVAVQQLSESSRDNNQLE